MQTDCFPEAIRDWPKAPIAAIAHVNPSYRTRRGVEYPFLEMAAVAEDFGGILRFDRRRAEGSGLARFRAGDTLFAKIAPCPQNGKVAFVGDLPGGELGLGSTEFVVLSARKGCDPRFLYHLVSSYAVRGRAVARMEGSTGRQRVPEEVFLKRLLVPVPSPSEQIALAERFDSVDDVIQATRLAIDRTEELQDSLIAAAFDGLSGAQCRLGEYISDIRYGTSRAASERGWGYPTLRIPNVLADELRLDDVTFVELPEADLRRMTLVDGDLLLVRTNGNPNYVGRSAVFRLPDHRTWAFASYLIRVRLGAELMPDYVNIFLGTERGRRELLRRVTTSAGNCNINVASIRMISIPVPQSTDDQMRVIELVHGCRERIAALRTKLALLRGLKHALYEDLLSGRAGLATRTEATA